MRSTAALIALLVTLTGCATGFPADPDGTLDRVSGGVLRVGVSQNEPWVVLSDATGPSGREVELVQRFADSVDARVDWSTGSEETLIGRLERGELDLVAAGLTAETPWVDQAAITKPYVTVEGPDGAEEHVLAAPLGENAFLVALERFLAEDGGSV